MNQSSITTSLQPPPDPLNPETSLPLVPVSSGPMVNDISLPAIPQPARHRTRIGKIARLPKDLREMVNRMLRNNIPYDRIVGALDEHEIKMTAKNLSNWKIYGGYTEWCQAEDRAIELRIKQDNMLASLRKTSATEIPEVGLQMAAARISEFFLTSEAEQLLKTNPEEYHRMATQLSKLTAEIHRLQKYRDDNAKELGDHHHPERVRRQDEQEAELTRKVWSGDHDDRDRHIPHRNYIPVADLNIDLD